jgi:hypothetical protein
MLLPIVFGAGWFMPPPAAAVPDASMRREAAAERYKIGRPIRFFNDTSPICSK